jgi:hypothetical protein
VKKTRTARPKGPKESSSEFFARLRPKFLDWRPLTEEEKALGNHPDRLAGGVCIDRVEGVAEIFLVVRALDVAQVRRGGDVGQRDERMGGVHDGLVLEYVERGPPRMALAQRALERARLHQLGAAHVHEHGIGTHFPEVFILDQTSCSVVEAQLHAQHVAFAA